MHIYKVVKKLVTLGPARSGKVFYHKWALKQGEKYLRARWQTGNPGHTWAEIVEQEQANVLPAIFYERCALRSIKYADLFFSENKGDIEILGLANLFKNNSFDLLGSGLQQFTQIPWHTDFRLRVQNPNADVDFDRSFFYKDIAITAGDGWELKKDIKVPWELSRFQHLLVLGKAYKLTGDQLYADAFVLQISDWLDNNQFLSGINWLCPMEVGLRAINWIVALEYLKKADVCSTFLERFICSLYDHMIFLENNWEIYDTRTNNHYLSNLIGYLYLCWFFVDFPKTKKRIEWCVHEIEREFEKQVFEEGTSYEGSTAYHQLVTELFVHAFLLCSELGYPWQKEQKAKLGRMIAFLEWCTPKGGSLIKIGDDDSGKVLYFGLTEQMKSAAGYKIKDQSGTMRFGRFGLSIIKKGRWHVSLRHHAYNMLQPSGHFHNDVGSITLCVDGVPFIVDPGSYVYTASKKWRNYFRSARQHNSFCIDGLEPVPLTNDLFNLAVPIKDVVKKNGSRLSSHCELYNAVGLPVLRTIDLGPNCQMLTIKDQWLFEGGSSSNLTLAWNFHLAPGVCAQRKGSGWVLLHAGVTLKFISSIPFRLQKSNISFSYGELLSSSSLTAVADVGVRSNICAWFS